MSDTTQAAPGLGAARSKPFGPFERMVAFRYLGATRRGAGVSLISIIAFAGIALAVAVLIVVMSIFQGFRTTLLDKMLTVDGHVFVETTQPLTEFDARAEQLRQVDGVTRVTPLLRFGAWVVSPNTAEGQGAVINGIRPSELHEIEPVLRGEGDTTLYQGFRGSIERFGDGKFGGNDIVLGWGLAAQLRVGIGDSVTLVTAGGAETAFGRAPTRQKEYRVAAIFDTGTYSIDSLYIYMPLEQAQVFTGAYGEVSAVEIRVEDPIDIDPYLQPIAANQGFDPACDAYFNNCVVLSDWRDKNRDVFNAVQVEAAMVRLILFFLVGIATMLIISGLVMLVKEKRSDIAVLRTMGASKGTVTRVFLLVGAALGVSGALAGVALGTLLALNLGPIEAFISAVLRVDAWNQQVYFLREIPSHFDWWEVFSVVSFTLVMSFIASVYPAWRASTVHPVEALRYE